MCLGTYGIARSVTSVKHTPSIKNTNGGLINPIPFNILLRIKLVLVCPERVRLSRFGSARSGVLVMSRARCTD